MFKNGKKLLTTMAITSTLVGVSVLNEMETVNAQTSNSADTYSPVSRIQGQTRFHTASKISQKAFTSAETVIIADSSEFADSLAGVPLAHQLNAPILLVDGDQLRSTTASEIGRLGAKQVIILGGEQAVSAKVEKDINSLNVSTRRIGGVNRFETAKLIADELAPSEQAVVVDGMEFADALSVASFAAQEGMPIFLTRTETLSNAEDLEKYANTLVIGGEKAVSKEVESELNNPTRLEGATRYDTNIEVLEHFGVDSKELFVSTGANFADALTGSVLVANNESGLGLVRPNTSENLTDYITENKFTSLSILGGESAISPEIESQLNDLFEVETASILHTNDIHGRMSVGDGGNDDVKGLEFVHGVFDHYESIRDQVLIMDAGDTFHGTNNVNLSEGETMIQAMNNMGYQVMAPGNHEFNYGIDRLLEIQDELDFPIVAANLEYAETGENVFPSYFATEILGHDVAVIGLASAGTPTSTHPNNVEGLVFTDEVEATQAEVDKLSEDFENIVILSHSGYSIDQKIAETVEGVDLIIGGHSHDKIDNPTVHPGTDTVIAQAWEHAKAVGVVDFTFVNGELLDLQGHLHDTTEGIDPNIETRDYVTGVVADVETQMSEVIGSIDVKLEGARENVRVQETNLGNLVADSMRQRVDAEIGIMNGGGIRESILPGEVTRGDVLTVLPFINIAQSVDVPGRNLLEALEYSYRILPAQNGGFLHLSGVEVVVDVNEEPGNRVQSVMVNGEPLDLDRVYSVGMNDFTAAGGDGYSMFEGLEVTLNTGELMSDLLMDWIASEKEIPEVEGRITIIPKQP